MGRVPARLVAHHPAELGSAHAGHVHVHHQEVGAGALQRVPEGERVLERGHADAARLQRGAEGRQHGGVVVHRQDVALRRVRRAEEPEHGVDHRAGRDGALEECAGAAPRHAQPVREAPPVRQDDDRGRPARDLVERAQPVVRSAAGQVEEDHPLPRRGEGGGRIGGDLGVEPAPLGLHRHAPGELRVAAHDDQERTRSVIHILPALPLLRRGTGGGGGARQVAAQRHGDLAELEHLPPFQRPVPGEHQLGLAGEARRIGEAERPHGAGELVGLALRRPARVRREIAVQEGEDGVFQHLHAVHRHAAEFFPQHGDGGREPLPGRRFAAAHRRARKRGTLPAVARRPHTPTHPPVVRS
jgi:hypothetical protein